MMTKQVRIVLSSAGFGPWRCLVMRLPVVGATISRRHFPDFAALIPTLFKQQRFVDVIAVSRVLRQCTGMVVDVLTRDGMEVPARLTTFGVSQLQIVAVAERIAHAHIHVGPVDHKTLEQWLVPLLQQTTEEYLSRMTVAQFLCEHIDALHDPARAVAAIEAHLPPRAWDDYSNFQDVFSLRTWRCLHPLLTHPRIITEHQRFVTRHDRREFWRAFAQPREEQR